jgi:TBC1 domain family member 5
MMNEIDVLYDPSLQPAPGFVSSDGRTGNIPPIVRYLTDFQNKHLADLDPELSHHLTSLDIHAQFYGLRWSRLLLGREFPLENTKLLRIWDTLIAFSSESIKSPLQSECVSEDTMKYSPLLEALRDFMIAMMINVSSRDR